ncbi:MAG: hypothetical protein KF682_07650 [Nitrospira sp.]|nr:hypothetical protein [Nitrospira sp.]
MRRILTKALPGNKQNQEPLMLIISATMRSPEIFKDRTASRKTVIT